MKIDQSHIDQLAAAFTNMQTKEDLLHVLNKAKPLVYGEKAVRFELKQLTWYANPKLGGKRYKEFRIKKKSGESRSIHAPVKGLKSLQKTLSFVLQCVFEPHSAAMGFVRDRSIVDNAKIHIGSKYVYNIDLKDFFPSIDQARVWKCLQLMPFNLFDTELASQEEIRSSLQTGVRKFITDHKEVIYYKIENNLLLLVNDKKGNYKKYKKRLTGHILEPNKPLSNSEEGNLARLREYNQKIKSIVFNDAKKYIFSDDGIEALSRLFPSRLNLASTIASICCTEMEVERISATGDWEKVIRNVLPQGAPTSPVITNIVCQRLDHLLSGVARRFGLKYSRYADDITFSSMHNVYQPNSEFVKELNRIILDQGFHIKKSKTRLQKDGYRQEVTGLLVNEKANVQHRYIKQLRKWLYYWERYGYDRASVFFLQEYVAEKSREKRGNPDMANVISGKLDYLKMVKGSDSELYKKLIARFNILSGRSEIKIYIDNQDTILEDVHNQETIADVIKRNNIIKIQPLNMVASTIENEVLHLPIIHYPKELVTLLKNFSINGSALKYTTHSWDAGRDANHFKDLSEFLSKALIEYNKFSYSLRKLSENLNGKIYNFLFNKDISQKGWGDRNPSRRIYFGWSSPELLDACRTDDSLNPEDYILPTTYQLQRSGKTLQKFKHVIDVFKNEIEIRDENSALLNLIVQKHDTFLQGFADPVIVNLDNKTFYTDVQWLGKALDLIFENIQMRPQNNLVSYTVYDKGKDAYVLEILHVDSYNVGKSILDEKLQLVKGNFGDICKYLKNLCDWSVESEFTEGSYRINYLVSNDETPPYEKLETSSGFKHILTFYK